MKAQSLLNLAPDLNSHVTYEYWDFCLILFAE